MKPVKLALTPRTAALVSVISNTTLVAGKIGIGLFTGSVAVLSEGLHSGLDLVAAVIALYSVSVSARPADQDHPYGHGKIENVSGMIEAMLIIAAGVFIVHQAIEKLVAGEKVEHVEIGLGIMLVSVIMNLLVSRILFRAAKQHDSMALYADAQHLTTDVYTSAGVLAGLFLVRVTGQHWLDPAAAIGVALLIVYVGLRVMRSSSVDLIDRKLPEAEEKKIIEIIEHHAGQYVNYHNMRTRKAGAHRFADLHLVVCGYDNVEEAHKFCDHIEKDIKREFKNMSISIHLEPCGLKKKECDDVCPLHGTPKSES
ncbi:MAG: cation diffusion facilitator family transporter [bacterium]